MVVRHYRHHSCIDAFMFLVYSLCSASSSWTNSFFILRNFFYCFYFFFFLSMAMGVQYSRCGWSNTVIIMLADYINKGFLMMSLSRSSSSSQQQQHGWTSGWITGGATRKGQFICNYCGSAAKLVPHSRPHHHRLDNPEKVIFFNNLAKIYWT